MNSRRDGESLCNALAVAVEAARRDRLNYVDYAVNELWVMDLASGEATRLVQVLDGGALDRSAAWSPDGRQILFVRGRYGGPLSAGWLGQLQLQAVDLAGAVRDVGALAVYGHLAGLEWCAPDTALATLTHSTWVYKIYAVDLTTGETTLVADGSQAAVLGCVR